MTRREFTGAVAPFLIVPRSVLGGPGQTPPSDRVNLACVGMGRQGMAVMMELLAKPEVQVVSVCDCNKSSKDYVEYGENALLNDARALLGPGYEKWGEDLASPGFKNLTAEFRTSLGMGGREPAKRLVEAYYASRKAAGYKGCTAYADYREMLEKEKGIDAVYVATPDHWHAPIAIAAMRKGKHVLGQKPMAHSVAEARRMAAVAAETKVATAVTVDNPTSPSTKLISSWIADGAIGRVREIHNWSSRPFWPQGVPRPSETVAVPEGLDWDMWVGPAPDRPYHPIYLPFSWRGWYDFGCGSFGDMGCYSYAALFQVLNLTAPNAVEASTSELFTDSYPKASVVHVDFPEHEGRAPVRLHWYDGGLMPYRPAGLDEAGERFFKRRNEGVMYIGDKGMILGGFNGEAAKVYPESPKYKTPAPSEHDYTSRGGAVDQWLEACRGLAKPGPASFINQGPVTEALLLGCLAQRVPNERYLYDRSTGLITNSEAANKLIDPPYRGQWT
jgi:predicted dehydrogenase